MNKVIKEYDKRGNLIYSKNTLGYESWREYDKNNNEIHYKDSSEYEEWYKYDENNKLIHCKFSYGFESWYKYIDEEQIEITQAEFEQIKRDKAINSYFNNNKLLRFELMDI